MSIISITIVITVAVAIINLFCMGPCVSALKVGQSVDLVTGLVNYRCEGAADLGSGPPNLEAALLVLPGSCSDLQGEPGLVWFIGLWRGNRLCWGIHNLESLLRKNPGWQILMSLQAFMLGN